MHPTTDHILLSLIAEAARLGDRDRHRLTSVAAIAATAAAGTMPALHVHAHDEALHVLRGSLTVFAAAEVISLGPGDSFLAPAGVPHTHRAEELTSYLTLAAVPCVARYEDWVRAVARPIPALAGDWPDSTEAAALRSIAGANDIAVLGPPGELPS